MNATITREARIVLADQPNTVALDFDPIRLPVTMFAPGTLIPMVADANDPGLIALVGTLIDDENEGRYTLVWSICGFEVKISCPNCGDIFPVSDAWLGPDAIHCGCDEDDM